MAVGTAAMGITGCAPEAKSAEGRVEPNAADAPSGSGHWSWSTPPEKISDSDVSETVECEILVIGLGSAGVPATVYAAAKGANVVTFSAASTAEAEGAYCGA